ncbi:MAG: HAD hydrolase-like protein, partial [Clostridiales bacterium]|nr:HAD hydrolase-like protein [Clostridiales bacterium]
MSKYKAVIFDFDGTVADTSEGVFNGIHYALKSIGKDETDPQVLSTYIGPPLFNTLRKYCSSDDEAQALMATYREYYSSEGLFEAHVYDGIPETLKALHESGIRTGVASAKPQ